ncbi:MAG: hypothetical protein AABZ60_14260 [Planctomycetota bacterium]
MKIRFFCSCGKEYLVGEDKVGKQTKCAVCQNLLKVPEKSQENIVVRCSDCQKLFDVLPYLLNKEKDCPSCGSKVKVLPQEKEEASVLYSDGNLDKEEYSYDFKEPEDLDQRLCNFCRVEVKDDEDICHSCGYKTKGKNWNMAATLPKIGKASVRQAKIQQSQERRQQKQGLSAKENPGNPKASSPPTASPNKSATKPPASPHKGSAMRMLRKRHR